MALAIVLNRRRQVPAEDSPAFGAIAERFRRAGELERAVALCQEGLQKYPKHLSSRVTLGWALLDLGRYDEARAELEKVLKRAPDNLAAIRGLAQLHDRTEHDDVAAMQTEPSRWADSEEVEVEPVEGDSGAFESPVQAAMPESLDTEPGPWIGLQADPVPSLGVPAEFQAIKEVAEPSPSTFFSHASEADALAAELLASTPRPQERVASGASTIDDRSWSDDGLELGAEHIQAAPQLLELVPLSPAANDNGFIPDDGPGPWPPVFADDDPPTSSQPALRLAHANGGREGGREAWPPQELRAAVRCAPAVDLASGGIQVSETPAQPQTGLLSALSRFRRRVDARKRAAVSEYVAG